jgi:uncharacterized membrane protein
VIAVALVISAIVYPALPDRVPTHWDAQGQPNDYSPRAIGAFLLPIIMLFTWGMMRVLPSIDPRRANYDRMRGAYDTVIAAVLTVLLLSHLAALAAMAGIPIPMTRVIPAIIGALFIVMGNVLPQARPNWFFGIRTPWTLSNDRVWQRTHRIGGYLFVMGGIVSVLSAALPFNAGFPVLLGAAAFAGLGSVIYSYIAWRQETSK